MPPDEQVVAMFINDFLKTGSLFSSYLPRLISTFVQSMRVNRGSEGRVTAGGSWLIADAYCWQISVVENNYLSGSDNVNVKGYIASPALGRTIKQEA